METNPGYLGLTQSQGLFLLAGNIWMIQQTWNSSSTFAFILSQKRLNLVSAHAQNFCSRRLSKKTYNGNKIAHPPRYLQRWQMKDIYHIYNFVKRLQCKLSSILGVRVAQSQSKNTKKMGLGSGHKQTYFNKIFCKNLQS